MSIGKNRLLMFVKGLGNLEIMEREPTPATVYSSLGNIESTVYSEEPSITDVVDERGDLVMTVLTGQKITLASNLLQSGLDEIDVMRNASGKIYATRYYGKAHPSGTYQYFCLPISEIDPKLALAFSSGGVRKIPVLVRGLKQSELTYDVPIAYVWQGNAPMHLEYIRLWIDPTRLLNTGTNKLLDISGFEQHGTLDADYASEWQSTGFIRLDGADQYCSLGDILDDDAASDFMIEGWFRIPAADGTAQELLSKRADDIANSIGWRICRHTDNTIIVRMDDGDTIVNITSAGTVLQNVWTHIAVAVDRNGNAQIYLNGAASGSAVSVASLTTLANAVSYYIGRLGTAYGQIDFKAIRHHIYGAGLLPSNITTIIDDHYDSEK